MTPQRYELDNMIAPHRLGMIVLQSDEVIEGEFREIFAHNNYLLHHSRIENAHEISLESLGAMKMALPKAVKLLPACADYHVIGYGCTSGATVIGSDEVQMIIQELFPKAKVTDPIKAVIAALHHLNVKKIGLLTPYDKQVSKAMITLLEQNNFSVTAFTSFEVTNDHIVAHISPRSISAGMIKVGQRDDVDVVFASCTNLRGLGIIKAVENQLRKPVITSNQALGWHIQQLLKAPKLAYQAQFGRLFE